jgi:hypothetical protein
MMSVGYGRAAEGISLPPVRPGVESHVPPQATGADFKSGFIADRPTDCDRRIAKIAVVTPVPHLTGPGACGGDEMVRIDGILLSDHSEVAIKPAARLRCTMAEQLALWVRDDVAPRVKDQNGAALRIVHNYDDYECRSRNRQPGGKLSEHGKGNAIDVRGFTLAGGYFFALTDVTAPKALRDDLREAACKRFATVLGPGSDGYHEEHIHLDLAERHNAYRICQWSIREPTRDVTKTDPVGTAGAPAPLLPPKPDAASRAKARKL